MARLFGSEKWIPFLLVLFTTLFFTPVFTPGSACADDGYVAQVSELKGEVTVVRDTMKVLVGNGTMLKQKDTLETGSDGSIGIIFNDDTALSLGPDSRLTIQEYIFEPGQSRFSFAVALLKGSAAYVSGLIAKLSPESARFITPSASIGIRGTKFVIQVDDI